MFHVLAETKSGDRQGRGRTLADSLKTVGGLQPRSTIKVTITWRPFFKVYPLDMVSVSGDTVAEAMEALIDEITHVL